MSDGSQRRGEESVEPAVPAPKDLEQVANDLCEKALNNAKAQLHSLIRSTELNRLDRRSEFVQAFKAALEQRIAKKQAAWQPGSRAFKRFSSSMRRGRKTERPGMVPFISS